MNSLSHSHTLTLFLLSLGVNPEFPVLYGHERHMDQDQVWNLIAKKLAGEASAGELKELESALRLDPDLHYSLEALHDMWKKRSRQDPTQGEAAFQKHMERMQSQGMDMGTPGMDLDLKIILPAVS